MNPRRASQRVQRGAVEVPPMAFVAAIDTSRIVESVTCDCPSCDAARAPFPSSRTWLGLSIASFPPAATVVPLGPSAALAGPASSLPARTGQSPSGAALNRGAPPPGYPLGRMAPASGPALFLRAPRFCPHHFRKFFELTSCP